MVDEKDISAELQWYFENLARRAIEALKKNNLDAEYVHNREEALAMVRRLIPPKGTIGCGESVTLDQIGFSDWLKQQKDHEAFSSRFLRPSDFSDSDSYARKCFELQRKALTADVFVTGTNAITLDGKLVNVDGHGNRVAAMIFGPNRVIVVAGVNKIVRDADEAIRKIHEYTAPINNKRHLVKHDIEFISKLPCTVTGACSYCHSENKSCRITTIIDGWSPRAKCSTHHPPTIIIVGELLGI